ncbi:glycosyltransferase [Nostoc sp.]|uniref:glycosyltransferase n=1 Tax=Nostoc sp. TaxID=1180 RepID=UPI002FFCE0F8
MENIVKPKLVFFQWKNTSLSQFIILHKQQHVKCLSEFFNVIVVNEDCNYQQICDNYQPELTLFESGTNYKGCQKLKISNTNAYPKIPKLGFHNGDSWCEARAGFLSDMENWGIETFFSIAITTAEHTPEIADNLFVWPNFIDVDTYRDYGQSKIIPVMFNGYIHNMYPWRQRIFETISKNYPSLICPHLGYSQKLSSRMMYGQRYARTINASYFVPTCGTVEKELVRKHLEIPASKSCLITEKTASVEASGFIDMQNCVFADVNDVLDKIDYLLNNLEQLEEITNAGYHLVHSRHTLKQRDQIFQWFNLYKKLQPNQKIIQTSPFEPLIVVEKSSGIKNSHIISNGLITELIHQGDEKLRHHQYKEAETLYLKCVNYISWMPEPKLRLAICNLYKGDANIALYWITQPIKYTLEEYQASDPDPVEWAYFIISVLCHGELDDAIKIAHQFISLSHPILDRTRKIISVLENQDTLHDIAQSQSNYRYSVHQLPDQSFDDWVNHICIMLRSCKQLELEKKLKSFSGSELQLSDKMKVFHNYDVHTKYYFKRYQNDLTNSLRAKIKAIFAQKLHYLETKFGYFLPDKFSKIKYDEPFCTIRVIAENDRVKSALLLGASNGKAGTESLLAGIQKNPNRPTVFCMNILTTRFMQLQKRYDHNNHIRTCQITSNIKEISHKIKTIKQENNGFDLVLIDGSEFGFNIDLEELIDSKYIILENINTFCNYQLYQKLMLNKEYGLVFHTLAFRNGYALFEKGNNHDHYLLVEKNNINI